MAIIAISALGSRGDVQPVVALGAALRARGHAVRVLTHPRFQGLVEGAGLEHRATGEGFESQQLWDSPRGLALAETKDPIVYGLRFFAHVAPHLERHLVECRDACADVDLVLGLHTVEMASAAVARALGKAYVPLFLSPPDPRFFHPPLVRWLAPRAADLASRMLGQRGHFAHTCERVLGREANAPPRRLRAASGDPLALVGISERVVARPADWDPGVVMTGYWFTDDPPEAAKLPAEVATFLDAPGGSPPVCIGFGSMPERDPRATAAIVVEAVRRAGVRAIVLAGYGGIGEIAVEARDRDLYFARELSHEALFPRVAAVVHHGGAGTTAAALRAGKPAMAVPRFGDQGFWGRQIAAIGAGAPPLPRSRMTAGALGRRLRDLTSDSSRRVRTAELGRTIARENGASRAAELLDTAWICGAAGP